MYFFRARNNLKCILVSKTYSTRQNGLFKYPYSYFQSSIPVGYHLNTQINVFGVVNFLIEIVVKLIYRIFYQMSNFYLMIR